jgi:flavin reductase (DIM6/NTAB) family NADH-FMN oxidoreductase RutF
MMKEEQQLGRAMKAGMRHLASGVAIAATRDAEGMAHAMTVTSVTSLTDQPPSLLVCLHRNSSMFKALAGTEFFSINLLRQDQAEISERCAFTPEDEDRFCVGEWREHGEYHIPYLDDALTCFLCRVSQKIDYGTHSIVIGDIVAVLAPGDGAQPLIYCRGEYRGLA